MKKICTLSLIFLFLMNIKVYSQELTLVSNQYQITQTFNFDSLAPSTSQLMTGFNNWLNKIDTVTTVSQNAAAYNGICNVKYNNTVNLKYSLMFQVLSSSYNYTINNCKYVINGSEQALEDVSDQNLKNDLLLFLNEHLLEITKTLNTELQDL